LLFAFEWELRWWERLFIRLGAAVAPEPGEVERRFGQDFEIES
jgi:hypothetical protein